MRDLDDVLAEIAPALRARAGGAPPTAGPSVGGEGDAARVLAILADGPATVDELVAKADLPVQRMIAMLLDLELSGAIRRSGSREFQLTGRFAGVGGLQ